jgi:hypothetical protein
VSGDVNLAGANVYLLAAETFYEQLGMKMKTRFRGQFGSAGQSEQVPKMPLNGVSSGYAWQVPSPHEQRRAENHCK